MADATRADMHTASPNGPYHVTARRDEGQGWIVAVQGVGREFTIRDLGEIEEKARRHVFGHTDRYPDEIELTVGVELPETTELRLSMAESLARDLGEEVRATGLELFAYGCVPADVWWIITHRKLTLQLAHLTITNAELAALGLSKHPRVTGVRWSDHGFAETTKCRDCVEATREEYVELDDDGINELLYAVEPCDFCDVGHDDEVADEAG